MGYRSNTFASCLRSKKTNTLGVIVPQLNSYFVASVLAGMEDIANEGGLQPDYQPIARKCRERSG